MIGINSTIPARVYIPNVLFAGAIRMCQGLAIYGQEIELKFALDAEVAAKLKTHCLLAPGEATVKNYVSTYFDTADLALRAAGLSLRLRKSDAHVIQTLKQRIRRLSGLFIRHQEEIEISGERPDFVHFLAHIPPSMRTRVSEPLMPIFFVEMERTEWILSWQGSAINIAVDQGLVTDGSTNEAFHELEVELRDGKLDAIFAVARALGKAIPLRPEIASKADRGYRLIARQKGPA